MRNSLVIALHLAKSRGTFLRVQNNAPDASYGKSMKYFLINCQNNKCVVATKTQLELVTYISEHYLR